jgi:peptidyl-Lys metalloendopeptidase
MKPVLQSAVAAGLLASAIAAATAATAAAPSAPNNPLRVGMYAAAGGQVEVIVTNTSRKAARVPRWELPSSTLQGKLFRVSLDGKPVQYTGMLAKRGLPAAQDFVVIAPGQSLRSVVDLGSAYDLAKAGQYTVTLASPLQHASMSDRSMLKTARGLPMLLQSAPMQLWHGGGMAKSGNAKGKPGGGGGGGGSVVNGVTYVGCSSTQISGAGAGVAQARVYSEDAKGYLSSGTAGSRYTTWLGAYTSSRYSTAKSHFVAIDNAIDQSGGQVTINCGCRDRRTYAYVYPTQPYQIYVCGAFWNAPTAGTDSKGGTLIHEMSHFNVTAGTDDIVYGQAGAKNLAATDPNGALNNADNHEYFAENNPHLN